MAATMTVTAPKVMTTAPKSSATASPCCPSCGTSLYLGSSDSSDPDVALLTAQKQIEDLQAQVRLLNQKAAAAVDKWADYEDELSRLRAASTTSAGTVASSQLQSDSGTTSATSPGRNSFLGAGANRLSQLLSPRSKSASNLTVSSTSRGSISSPNLSQQQQPPDTPTADQARPPPPPPKTDPGPSKDVLLQALDREKSLRRAAEGKLQDTSKEVEELSVSLFEQANEMVASERRARAKLEERVSVLEQRDEEKRGRLERLEGAMLRIERVRNLLGDK
jgi:vacuolar-type H+-ATPase subunit I/STV1